ncbi:MAG TPA: WYL domain-containing protein [Gemmatimonadales bacterium]|nr:WYL domain-containing protein [Gemmatimonadales bacterium]
MPRRKRGGETQRRSPKVQRWIDLLAALLARNYPVTVEQLFREVPDYGSAKFESARRKFERDKDELKSFGVPIELRQTTDGNPEGYVLDRREFYLPYLALQLADRRITPRKPRQYGYHALRSLMFEADELAAVVEAARRVRALGDPDLADAAGSAMRKLAFDLPIDAVETPPDPQVVPPQREPDRATFERLAGALERRKRVAFRYRSMHADAVKQREAEPYGLFFVGQHWYLAARDPAADGLRSFRLSRMSGVRVNPARAQSPDYAVPAAFHLQEYARSKQAWELGDAGAIDAVVRCEGQSGAAAAAAELGEPVPGDKSCRRFKVRRPDAFARWLLALGGELRPVEPPEVVQAFERVVADTLALYGAQAGRRDA